MANIQDRELTSRSFQQHIQRQLHESRSHQKSGKVHLLLSTLHFTINWPDRKRTFERRSVLLSNTPPAKVL